ncbi:hypothetical protein ACWG0P_10785 [Amedibacillus sp. YH-ame6]
MKYLNSNDLMMFLEKPITRLSVFEAETVDAILIMCAEAFPKLEKDFSVKIDFPTFKFQVLKTMGEFLSKCKECNHECLKNPRKRIEQERYDRNHIIRSLWPTHIQKENAENFFIMEYCLTYADILYRYLLDAGLPNEFTHRLAENAMLELAKWIDKNCIMKCKYECIRRSDSMGYCTLCSYMIQSLACPLKEEIHVNQLGMQADEIQCMRKENLIKK